eukprot:1161149-Pelagomonas_calceolata.AAC.8
MVQLVRGSRDPRHKHEARTGANQDPRLRHQAWMDMRMDQQTHCQAQQAEASRIKTGQAQQASSC